MATDEPSGSWLPDFKPRQWKETREFAGVAPVWVYHAPEGVTIEVAYARAHSRPTNATVTDLWKARSNKRATGVVVVVEYQDGEQARAAVKGPDQASPVTHHELSVVERVMERALDATTTREARDTLADLAGVDGDDDVTGLHNSGLFAQHALVTNTRQRPDWVKSGAEAAQRLRGQAGDDLLRALGWTLAPQGDDIMLKDGEQNRAVAVLLSGDEVFDRPSFKYGLGISPVEHAVQVARKFGVDWVLAVQGARVRLYSADPDAGVARTGVASFTELNVDLLDDQAIAYAWLLLTPPALRKLGTVHEILDDSRNHAAALGTRLRDRIYEDVVKDLANIVARRAGDLTDRALKQAYHITLVILFRLLFVAYAEDRELLPYREAADGRTTAYSHKALKTLARAFTEVDRQGAANSPNFDRTATTLWDDLRQVWRAIYQGNTDWGVPAYGGNLFREDTTTGAEISSLALTNAEIGPILRHLLVDTGPDGISGPVDFRALSVREFGTIYEGLLESSLSVAPEDYTVDPKTLSYVPVKGAATVAVRAGDIFFHNASGERKSTGSYFTKDFVVEHLLESALVPAVESHLGRVTALLASGREADAASALFRFRVADIAMGSGHFLVAAVNYISRAFEDYLGGHQISGVAAELDALRAGALAHLIEAGAVATGADAPQIRTSDLIRRQVAKRCIYGVDTNEIAVELGRLALWIHTFVPGLPMSSLEHGLVHGNSLTGIASTDELVQILEPTRRAGHGLETSFYYDDIADAIAAAEVPLARAARLAEVSLDESREAEKLRQEASEAVDALRCAADAAVASRLEFFDMRAVSALGWAAVVGAGARTDVRQLVDDLAPIHFPVAFPECFHGPRETHGFDVLIGNPPWDKLRHEPQQFWLSRVPGLNALSAAVRDTRIKSLRIERPADARDEAIEEGRRHRMQDVAKKCYVLLGSGHYDYAKLFVERYLGLVAARGSIAVVLPNNFSLLGGWAKLREACLKGRDAEVVEMRNAKHWLFSVHASYAIVLFSLAPSAGSSSRVTVFPGVSSLAELRRQERHSEARIVFDDVGALSEDWVVPWFDDPRDSAVFRKFLSAPRLGSGEGWIEGRTDSSWDFSDTGRHRSLAETTRDSKAAWGVLMARHVDSYRISTDPIQRWINKPENLPAARGIIIAHNGIALSPSHGTIVHRFPSRADDSRTLIATALPSAGFLPSKGYVHAVAHPRPTSLVDRLALLGYMNSACADWWVRRFVDRHVGYRVINGLPLPDWGVDDRNRAARLVATLLVAGGTKDVPGSESISELALTDTSEVDARVELDRLAFSGFGLGKAERQIVLADFRETEAAFPPAYRSALLEPESGR